MKRPFWLVFSLIFLAMPALAWQAQVEDISSGKYFEAVLGEIRQAESSLTVCMYLAAIDNNKNHTRPYALLEALAEAHKRGVRVKVILDRDLTNVDKNRAAFDFLKAQGVPVFYDTPQTITHAKALVIDGRTVIGGSTNWSQSALTRNNETSFLLRSEELASAVLKDIDQIALAQELPDAEGVMISRAFLTQKELLGRMASSASERIFDTYLFLLKEYDGNPEGKLILRHQALARSLGIEAMGPEGYRRQIAKALGRLRKDYRLIDFTTVHKGDAEVMLKNYGDPEISYSLPEQDFFEIPVGFWEWGWNCRLSLSAKVMYLLNLSYAAASKNPPRWQTSVQTLSEKHHVSKWFLSRGTVELRRADLVEVKYDAYQENPNGLQRWPNIYFLNPLYDPAQRLARLQELEALFGAAKVKRARAFAAVVYEDSDVNGIQTLIELENRHGTAVVKKAVQEIGLKHPDNPLRSMAYLIAKIRGMGEDIRDEN